MAAKRGAIPRVFITIREVKGGKFCATVADLDGNESLDTGEAWGIRWRSVEMKRKTFDKAARAATDLLAANVKRWTYDAIYESRGEATETHVTV